MSMRGETVAGVGAVPELEFEVEDAEVEPYAASPTLRFTLDIESAGGVAIRALALDVQIRIAAARRLYDAAARERLGEVFGAPQQWATSLRSLHWMQTTLQVPPFAGRTRVGLPVACTYDFEVTAAKYFHALDDGVVPLEFLFSGAVFYLGEGGALQAARVAWDKEATYRMPVRLWKDMMEHHFANSTWIRLHRDVFDRLYAYRVRNTLPTWEAALDALLSSAVHAAIGNGGAGDADVGTAEVKPEGGGVAAADADVAERGRAVVERGEAAAEDDPWTS